MAGILVLGGTRFVGRRLVERLFERGHDVSVLTRRPENAPAGARLFAGERDAVLRQLAGSKFEAIVDFIAYDEAAVSRLDSILPEAPYVLISTVWLVRGAPTLDADAEEIDLAWARSAETPEPTRRYVAGKLGAEAAVARRRARDRRSSSVRLPILWGTSDHTGRTDFYRRRLADGRGVILVDGGRNVAQVAFGDDVAAALALAVESGVLARRPVWNALADDGMEVRDLVAAIAAAESLAHRVWEASKDVLARRLPSYLDAEPLWRERRIGRGRGNLFEAIGYAPAPFATWYGALGSIAPDRTTTRDAEIAFLAGAGHA